MYGYAKGSNWYFFLCFFLSFFLLVFLCLRLCLCFFFDFFCNGKTEVEGQGGSSSSLPEPWEDFLTILENEEPQPLTDQVETVYPLPRACTWAVTIPRNGNYHTLECLPMVAGTCWTLFFVLHGPKCSHVCMSSTSRWDGHQQSIATCEHDPLGSPCARNVHAMCARVGRCKCTNEAVIKQAAWKKYPCTCAGCAREMCGRVASSFGMHTFRPPPPPLLLLLLLLPLPLPLSLPLELRVARVRCGASLTPEALASIWDICISAPAARPAARAWPPGVSESVSSSHPLSTSRCVGAVRTESLDQENKAVQTGKWVLGDGE